MTLEKQSPAARAGAHRAECAKCRTNGSDKPEPIPNPCCFQVAYVSGRYRLSPCLARVVCHLAQIGERLS